MGQHQKYRDQGADYPLRGRVRPQGIAPPCPQHQNHDGKGLQTCDTGAVSSGECREKTRLQEKVPQKTAMGRPVTVQCHAREDQQDGNREEGEAGTGIREGRPR